MEVNLIAVPRKPLDPASDVPAHSPGSPAAGVVLYTAAPCPYCSRAKRLLDAKGVSYTEIDVGMDASKRREMMHLAGGRHTVPQIFIGGRHVGGFDELAALENAGELDEWLEAAA